MGLISLREWFKIYERLDELSIDLLEELLEVSRVEALKKYKGVLHTLEMLERGTYSLSPLTKRYKYFNDIEDLTFAQFISIESTLAHVKDSESVYVLVCSELLRPLWEEQYDNDDVDRNKAHREAIGDEPMVYIYKLFNEFMKLRADFHFKKYRDVFLMEGNSEDAPEHDSATSFYRNWHWYSYVRELSGEDISRYEQTMLMPMKLIAPEISYRQGLAKVERQRIAEQQAIAKSKMRR